MTDEQFLLASAYADGDVTVAERARAEADPVVMAEVDQIRMLQTRLADVTTPDPARRTAMIATAMASFGAAAPAADPAPGHASPDQGGTPLAPAIPIRRGGLSRRLGLVAAAVAVVAVGAVAVANQNGGGGGDFDMASQPTLERAPEVAADQARTFDAADDEGAAATSMLSEADPAPAELEATIAAAGTAAAALIAGPDELASAGALLAAAYDASNSDRMSANACSLDQAQHASDQALPDVVGPVELLDQRDYLDEQGRVQPVYVAVDLGTTQTYAIDATTCVLVAIGTTP